MSYTDSYKQPISTPIAAFAASSSTVSSASTACFPSSLPIVSASPPPPPPPSCRVQYAAAAAAASPQVTFRPDPELENKVKKTSERISENLHICANEPSLALYRLAEHVRKALPPTTESRVDVRRIRTQLCSAYSEAEDGLGVVRSCEGESARRMANAADLLKNAIFLQQQIKYEQQKRRFIQQHYHQDHRSPS